MKFDFKTIKEKFFHKSSDENELPKEVKKASNNKLNYICIGVLIVGIILTFASYFLYKDMYISVIVIMIFIFISSFIYYLSTLKINKLNNDPELKIKKQFNNRWCVYAVLQFVGLFPDLRRTLIS